MKQTLSKTLVLITIIFMDLLTGMEFDIFAPSFPGLQSYFHLSAFWVEALLSVNFIGYCLSLFFVGALADRYGRKPIIFLGLITFIFGSILCLFTSSYSVFLLGRFLQGVGIAAPAILSFLIIADAYSLKEQQFLLSMLNGAMNTAVAIAPVIGSYLTLYFHWQGNFVALLILGCMVLLMTIGFIPASQPTTNNQSLSIQEYLPIFQSKPMMLIIFFLFVMFMPYWVFVGMSPLLYIKDLGVSLAHFGFYQGILALVFAFGSLCFGLLIKNGRYEQKNMLRVASLIFVVSLLLIASVTFSDSKNPLYITLVLLSFVIGQIIPSNILYPLCLSLMPHAKGKVTAIIQGGRLIFSALSLQIAGYFYQGTFQNIGMIILFFIVIGMILLFFVIRNPALQQQPSTT